MIAFSFHRKTLFDTNPYFLRLIQLSRRMHQLHNGHLAVGEMVGVGGGGEGGEGVTVGGGDRMRSED